MTEAKLSEERAIFTIGHSNHSLDKFIDLLKSYKIDVLVDVRSKPFSRFSPQFNKEVRENRDVHEKTGTSYSPPIKEEW